MSTWPYLWAICNEKANGKFLQSTEHETDISGIERGRETVNMQITEAWKKTDPEHSCRVC